MSLRVTFLGTGTSHGIPRIGCDCAVCRSDDPRNNRLRPSILVEADGTSVVVDAAPDFRTQALRANLRHVDAVLLTHAHADHMLGLDDMRVFTERGQRKLPLYSLPATLADVQRMFPYACTDQPAWPSLPSFALCPLTAHQEFSINALRITPVPVLHARLTVLGFLFNRELAYLTDCHHVPPATIAAIQGVKLLVIDGLRHRPHASHLTVAQALEVARAVGAPATWLTHLCHELDHAATEAALPAGVRIAYDGLQVAA